SYIYFEKYILRVQSSFSERNTFGSAPQFVLYHSDIEVGWARVVAAIIDLAIVILLVGIYAMSFGVQSSELEYQVKGFEAMMLLIVIWFCLFPLFEFLLGGTIGKRILGLRVVMLDGSKLTLEAALKRHLLDVVDLVFVAWMVPFPKHHVGPSRRMGDRWAKTKVVRRLNKS
ncbi:MAG: RDD family protein, partial [Ignavibacteriales bacterium]|nr:RDD family protein [Ignavibacteriales bacterium]